MNEATFENKSQLGRLSLNPKRLGRRVSTEHSDRTIRHKPYKAHTIHLFVRFTNWYLGQCNNASTTSCSADDDYNPNSKVMTLYEHHFCYFIIYLQNKYKPQIICFYCFRFYFNSIYLTRTRNNKLMEIQDLFSIFSHK